MVLSSEWSQVEVIDLIHDGSSLGGLGFILVGGRSTGVVIKALIPGGIAERDGRLQCGDHVLQIGDVNLRGDAKRLDKRFHDDNYINFLSFSFLSC
jgi:C-terminal processing protease CtpA/Prc